MDIVSLALLQRDSITAEYTQRDLGTEGTESGPQWAQNAVARFLE